MTVTFTPLLDIPLGLLESPYYIQKQKGGFLGITMICGTTNFYGVIIGNILENVVFLL